MTRRHQRMLRYALLSVAVLVVPLLLWALLRARARPYSPGETVAGVSRSLERFIPDDYPRVEFRDVAAQAGIRFRHFHGERSSQLPEDMGSGAAWGDFDNDGHADLYIVNIAGPLTAASGELDRSPESGSPESGSPACSRLYRNRGDGTFADVTDAAGVAFRGMGMGAAWGDSDGDGWLDLLVTSFGGLRLYRNNGDGTFRDVTEAAGLGGFRGFWAGASWADYDGDGRVDFYVCGYVRYVFQPADLERVASQYGATVPFTLNPSAYPPERNLLFHNEGGGRFREVAQRAGVDNLRGRSLAAAWCDFDGDGRLDLYVANDVSDNALFRNLGNGRFADVSHSSWSADYRGAMGLGIGDWDGDGAMDIFITHWLAQENALYRNLTRDLAAAGRPPELRFMDVADQVGLGQVALDYVGWGTSFLDYDNDGRPDLFVVNGSTFQQEGNPRRLVAMKNQLFWNRGEPAGFFEVGRVSGSVFAREGVGRGAAFADFDNDGDVDVLVVNHGEAPLLLRNDGGNRNRWLRVQVRAARGNRFGLGALVRVTAGSRTQVAQIGSQPSYLSQNPYEVHFGLGQAEQADTVEVRFSEGRTRVFHSVPANRVFTASEER